MIAVIGNGDADVDRDRIAADAGAVIVGAGYGLVCGGLGGVMSAACRGAHSVTQGGGPPIVAILPGDDKEAANAYADVVIPSGFGYGRNLLVILAADAVVAIGGQSGTLSEMAHAWQLGKPLCALAGAPGWAMRLAGEALDDRRSDSIAELASVDELEAWLHEVLSHP